MIWCFLIAIGCLWLRAVISSPPRRIARTTIVFVSKVPDGIEYND